MKKFDSLIIEITEAVQEPGYFYYIYNGSIADRDSLPEVGGGLCTSEDYLKALDMAIAEVKAIESR